MKLDFDGRFDCVLMLDVAKGSTESFINSSSIILLRRWICSVERKLLPILRSVWPFLLLFNLGQEYTYETSFQFSITCLWQALISCLKTRHRLLNIFYHTLLSSFNLFVLVALYSRKFEKRTTLFVEYPFSIFHQSLLFTLYLQQAYSEQTRKNRRRKFLRNFYNACRIINRLTRSTRRSFRNVSSTFSSPIIPFEARLILQSWLGIATFARFCRPCLLFSISKRIEPVTGSLPHHRPDLEQPL